jgi:RHS repeat-associated protein
VAQVDTTTGAVTFLHGDLIGSTRAATDASGTVVGTWDYTPFGVVTTATGGANSDGVGVTRFLFAGEYQDDSGLYFLRARFYDPVTASFLSVDPALSATGSPYAYASGNPLQLVDPLGLFSMSNAVDSLLGRGSVGEVGGAPGSVPCGTSGGFFGPNGGVDWPAPSEFLADTAKTAMVSFLGNFKKITSTLWRAGKTVGSKAATALKKAPWMRHTLRVSARYGTNLAAGSLDGLMAVASAADNYFFRYDSVERQSDRIQFTLERALVTEGSGALVGSQTDPLAMKICVVTEGIGCGPAIAGSAVIQTATSEGMGLLYDWLNEGRVAAASGDESRRRRFMASDLFGWSW